MSTQESVPTQDDCILAALAHVSAMLPFMGVVSPIVIWVTQKDKSPYVAFQALQAAAYQLTMIVAWLVGMGCYMCSIFTTFFGMLAISGAGSANDTINGPASVVGLLTFFIPFVVLGLMLLGGAAFVIYGVVGAVQTLRGKNFRYLIIGARLEQYRRQGKSAEPADAVSALG